MSNSQQITVFYKWTAKPGKLDDLKAIYADVLAAMKENESGATRVDLYYADADNSLFVEDVFADGAALGYHLSQTAAQHFPKLLEIATPGPFYFCGEVPEELAQAALGMGLQAEFGSTGVGFSR